MQYQKDPSPVSNSYGQSSPSPVHASSKGVHIVVDEKIVATADKDGGLQSLEIKGDVLLKVLDSSKACVRLTTASSGDPSIQFKVSLLL